MKTFAIILFALLLGWPKSAPAPAASCCGELTVITSATCCCAPDPLLPDSPVSPVPTRPGLQEPMTLLMPTVTPDVIIEQAARPLLSFASEFPNSAGAVALFQRDCAWLI